MWIDILIAIILIDSIFSRRKIRSLEDKINMKDEYISDLEKLNRAREVEINNLTNEFTLYKLTSKKL